MTFDVHNFYEVVRKRGERDACLHSAKATLVTDAKHVDSIEANSGFDVSTEKYMTK